MWYVIYDGYERVTDGFETREEAETQKRRMDDDPEAGDDPMCGMLKVEWIEE